MDWNEIITCINSSDKTYDADKQLATLIVQNDAKAVHYYLKDIGTPIMEYIEHVITKENITGEYYIFLSSPFDTEEERPLWHRVELYKGLNSSLSSYTSKITIRHFCYIVNKEKKIQTKSGGILEYVDYDLSQNGVTRRFAFNLKEGEFTITGVKYAEYKITIKTTFKSTATSDKNTLTTSFKSTHIISINLDKKNTGGYYDSIII